MKTIKNITQGENIMKRTVRLTQLMAITGMACLATTMSAQAVVIETVTIGNPGNGPDTNTSGNVIAKPEGAGAVGYVYEMGKYEVTQGQYTEFLNAVGATDKYGLYHPAMYDDPFFDDNKTTTMISQSGVSGSFTYAAHPTAVNRPVNFVSWGDAARFANWMHNGQPSGAQDNSTTEDGSYFLNGMNLNSELANVPRKASGATWVIPSEDEWYKAAYHKNDGVTDNYWDMPMQNDLDPAPPHDPGEDPNNPVYTGGSDITEETNPGNNQNHWTSVDADPIDGLWRVTNVGQFDQSVSAYGTFDQAGNVFEWNEAMEVGGNGRGTRGQGFGSGAGHNSSARSNWYGFVAKTDRADFGFRLAKVPEPSSLVLLLGTAGALSCLTWRRMQK